MTAKPELLSSCWMEEVARLYWKVLVIPFPFPAPWDGRASQSCAPCLMRCGCHTEGALMAAKYRPRLLGAPPA